MILIVSHLLVLYIGFQLGRALEWYEWKYGDRAELNPREEVVDEGK